MPIHACALVKPSVPKTRIHAKHNVILGAHRQKIGDIEMEGCVSVVVAANKAAIHKHQHVAESPVKLHAHAPARIAGGNLELMAIPTHRRLGIAAAEWFVAMRLQVIIPYKRQFHGPVMRKIHSAPTRVVKAGFGKFEIARLCKVSLVGAEAKVFR